MRRWTVPKNLWFRGLLGRDNRRRVCDRCCLPVVLALGAGAGLSTASPWSGSGASSRAFTIGAAVWLIVVQWLSAAPGGYVTGRLRTKWVGVHTDEVFFRDTAHGLIAWCVAAVVSVGLLTSSVAAAVNGASRMTSETAGASQGASSQPGGPTGYS